ARKNGQIIGRDLRIWLVRLPSQEGPAHQRNRGDADVQGRQRFFPPYRSANDTTRISAKPERLFHCVRNGAQLRLIHAAAQNRRDLDLYLGTTDADQYFGHGLFGRKCIFGYLRAGNAPPDALSNSSFYLSQTVGAP